MFRGSTVCVGRNVVPLSRSPVCIVHGVPSRGNSHLSSGVHDADQSLASPFLSERSGVCSNMDSIENGSPWKDIMRIHSSTTIPEAVLITLLFTLSAYARDPSALNGTWTLVPAKSDFAGQPVVQTGTVTIADREGIIIVSRSFVYEGATETFFYSDVTDSEHNATIHTGKDLKSKTRWDHDVMKVTTTESGAITLESYTLAADGTMLVSVERPEHKPITLVFQHK